MSIKKFKVLNVRYLPLGLSEALGLSELVLDAHTKISTERRFFRQERVHPEHGRQRLDYYPDEEAACIECLDTISFLNILEATGLMNSSVVSSIPQAVIMEALREAAAEDEIQEQELRDFWKAPHRVRGL